MKICWSVGTLITLPLRLNGSFILFVSFAPFRLFTSTSEHRLSRVVTGWEAKNFARANNDTSDIWTYSRIEKSTRTRWNECSLFLSLSFSHTLLTFAIQREYTQHCSSHCVMPLCDRSWCIESNVCTVSIALLRNANSSRSPSYTRFTTCKYSIVYINIYVCVCLDVYDDKYVLIRFPCYFFNLRQYLSTVQIDFYIQHSRCLSLVSIYRVPFVFYWHWCGHSIFDNMHGEKELFRIKILKKRSRFLYKYC